MLMALLAGLLVATVPLFGGRLRALAHVRIKSFWLIAGALALQVVAISVVPTWPRTVLVSAHLVSYLMAGWFVWLNRRVSGLPIVALGGVLNAVTIAVNGGTLPASRSALATAGIHPVAGDFNNSGVLAHPHLAWLGDVIPVPASVPMANVFSIGDLLILLGLAYGLHHLCGSRLVRSSRRAELTAAAPARTTDTVAFPTASTRTSPRRHPQPAP
ncbi:MAG TPA: DUF5317 domain-containing protein [Acidothermaceae bacterium]|nr:DUF5317 domain-containing protein [Acidothermaceae bacterium]